VILMALIWNALTKPNVVQDFSGLEQMGGATTDAGAPLSGGLAGASAAGGLQEPPARRLQEPPAERCRSRPRSPRRT
jgi:hypothetical protein